MDRRNFLKLSGAGLSAFALGPAFTRAAFAQDAACYTPFAADTPLFEFPTKKPPYRIALLNSFIGNDWRTEMIKIAKAYAARPDVAKNIKQFQVANSGTEVAAQIAQFNQFLLQGLDIIVTDAASPTGLNNVVADAADAGVLVVSFDNIVTSDRAIAVNHDQKEMGKVWAQWIVDQIGGKGKVLLNRGVAGTFGDKVFSEGGMEVFAKHPDIQTVEVYGEWDQGTSQKVVSDALAAGHTFDAVWSEYGDTGVVRAFLQAGQKVPPIAGQAENGFRKLAAQHKFPILSAGVSPGLVAASMKTAFDILGGKQLPQSIRIPLDTLETKDLKAGVNYFPDLPDSFIAGFNVPQCGLEFTAEEILAQKS